MVVIRSIDGGVVASAKPVVGNREPLVVDEADVAREESHHKYKVTEGSHSF